MDALLTIREVSQHLRISESMTRKLMRTAGLPFLSLGRRKLVRITDLEQWITEHVQKAGAA
jgi:excisionase family DNA binding protein